MEHNASPTDNARPAPAEVCVLTARGMAAIASIALAGAQAVGIVEAISEKHAPPCGRSTYGTIKDDGRVIDSVVIACERPACFVIHCHGNPLLVDQIVRLCRRHGAIPQPPHDLLFARYRAEAKNLLEAEARLAMTQAVTREGVALLQGQIAGGLSAWATRWINDKSFDSNKLKLECAEIIERSRIARRILEGVRIALVGPPNSGKSTLLNWLAGTGAALVSETAGTTRDWVSAVCRIGPLRAEIIDTAGLDAELAAENAIEKAAQAVAIETAATSDLILVVQDSTCPKTRPVSVPSNVPVLNIFTKIDLVPHRTILQPGSGIPVSAQHNHGLDRLCSAIRIALDAENLSVDQPICFNPRQMLLLEAMVGSNDTKDAVRCLHRLLRGEDGPANQTEARGS